MDEGRVGKTSGVPWTGMSYYSNRNVFNETMERLTRRDLLAMAAPLAAGTALGFGTPAASVAGEGDLALKKRKILVVGAHPDDPETGCGGLMALAAAAGHEVVSVYLTRGEAGCRGKSHEESAAIRMAEAREACALLGARPVFLSQVDGSSEVNRERYQEVNHLIKAENPDLLVTHWPIDSHRDHRVCSILVYDAWQSLDPKPALAYFEVMSGHQSQNFNPTHYVDISRVLELKHKACFAHRSQNIEGTYDNDHGKMEVFRGMESGFRFAEGYVKHILSRGLNLEDLNL